MADAQATEPQGDKDKDKPRKQADTGPSFARGYPDDPELRELLAAFERGAHNVVRDRAEKLAQSTSNPDVARAARDLRSRLEPDPLAVKLLLAAVALLIFLSAWAYHTAH
jgi:hypothetical protein